MRVEPPYGTFPPTAMQRAIMACFHGTPLGYSRLRRIAVARFKAERPTPVDASLFGLKVRFHPHDNQTDAKAAVSGHCYNPSEQRWLRKALPHGGTFVDIGANMGFFSLFAAKLGASVIAVEAHPEMFRRLATNMALNRFSAALFNQAVGSVETEARLVPGDRDLGGSSFEPTPGAGPTVRMRPLLAILQEAGVRKIDALKIDVEGHEDHVLVPFLTSAPVSLLPGAIILEHSSRQEWETDVVDTLIRDSGYVERARNRANMLLCRRLLHP